MTVDGGHAAGAAVDVARFDGVVVTNSHWREVGKCAVGPLDKGTPEAAVLVIHAVH